MPCGPRRDAPDALHHVRGRGIEGRASFRDDQDRDDVLRRLGAMDVALSAWAFVPNPLHLVRRTGATPLARAMRALLTGYAGAFTRRPRRRGQLLQNRSTSSVGEAEPDRLALGRDLHRNPLRAQRVADLRALGRDPYTGQAVRLGRRRCPAQDTGRVLGRLGPRPARAREGIAC